MIGLFTGFLAQTVNKEKSYTKDLKLLLELTDVLNQVLDKKELITAFDPHFRKIEKINNWDIALYDERTGNFSLIKQNKTFTIKDLDQKIVEFMLGNMTFYKNKNINYFPLSQAGKFKGYFEIELKDKKDFGEEEIAFFMTFAKEFVLALERIRLYEELKHLAQADRLTDSFNYGYFLEILDERVKRKKEFVIIMIDADNFKSFNDVYGHIKGNVFLKKMTEEFKRFLGKNGILARYGGDEFVVLLERFDEDLLVYLKRFKKEVEDSLHVEESKIRVTISMGYSVFPKDGETAEEILSRADKLLYKAKSAGKNRVGYL